MNMKTFAVGLAAVLVAALSVSVFAAPPASPPPVPSVTSDSTLSAAGAGKGEVSMGDLVADAVRSAAKADIAFVSASELNERAGQQIPKGKVASSDIAPFIAFGDDPIVSTKLSGKQIRQALERSLAIYPQKNLGFVQVSGLSFTFDAAKPQKSRIISVKVGDSLISDTQTYTVAMTKSLANGALGYWMWSKSDIVTTSQINIPKAVELFFTGRTSISYATMNRITIGK